MLAPRRVAREDRVPLLAALVRPLEIAPARADLGLVTVAAVPEMPGEVGAPLLAEARVDDLEQAIGRIGNFLKSYRQ